MSQKKDIRWQGSSKEDLIDFPEDAKRLAGHELNQVQSGLDPTHWKPFEDVGKGVREIIVDDKSGWFRVMYVTKFEEAVYVLHCFQKKTNTTSKKDKEIASARYKALIQDRKDKK